MLDPGDFGLAVFSPLSYYRRCRRQIALPRGLVDSEIADSGLSRDSQHRQQRGRFVHALLYE